MAGDIEAARKLHYLLFQVNKSVSGSFGVAGVKYAMEICGFYGSYPRLPLLPLRRQDQEFIGDAVKRSGLLIPERLS